MPYKDPERKRQWEREHLEERNARRRTSYLPSSVVALSHDPVLEQCPYNSWGAIGILIVLPVLLIYLPLMYLKVDSKRG